MEERGRVLRKEVHRKMENDKEKGGSCCIAYVDERREKEIHWTGTGSGRKKGKVEGRGRVLRKEVDRKKENDKEEGGSCCIAYAGERREMETRWTGTGSGRRK